jgi:hypothetical protein
MLKESTPKGRRDPMHDAMRRRILRRLEALPETQLYQVLDYIEFLESRYNRGVPEETTPLQKLAERLEDGLRKGNVNPANVREAFQLISTADRVLSSVSARGRQLLEDLQTPPAGGGISPSSGGGAPPSSGGGTPPSSGPSGDDGNGGAPEG